MTTTLSFDVVVEQPTIAITVDQPVIDVDITETPVGAILVGGPPGPQGAIGPQGPIGPQGATGATGPVAQWFTQVITNGDGVTTSFLLSHQAASTASINVFRNGLAEVNGIGFLVEAAAGTTAVTFTTAPLATDVIAVTYEI